MTGPALAGLLAAASVLCLTVPAPWPVVRPLPVARHAHRQRARPLARLGAVVRRAARLQGSPLTDAALGTACLLLLATLPLAPPLVGLAATGIWAQAHVARRRTARERDRKISDALPDSVDLLLLCTGAGLALPLAMPLVAARTRGPLGDALAAADAAAGRGQPRADATVAALAPLGDRAVALGHVLVDHLRYGTELGPGLERLGLELRLGRRRRAEEAARRVPVRLLLPLVACVLPAFALLTVVPLLAASLESLPT